MEYPARISLMPVPHQDNFVIGTVTGTGRADLEFTASADLLDGSRDAFRLAVAEALAGDGVYPEPTGIDLLTRMLWAQGLARVVAARPPYVWYTMNERTFSLLPEMVPLPVPLVGDDGRVVQWLDQLAPSVRTFSGSSGEEPRPRRDRSVAIVFQEGDPALSFDIWAARVADVLRGAGLVVDEYPGGTLIDHRRIPLLSDIFYKHAAVLFVGHLGTDRAGHYGWMLTGDHVLAMRDLAEFLLRPARQTSERIPAEVVVAACCASAWRSQGQHGWPGLLFPKVFLDGGVRYFVGAWMNIVGPSPATLGDLVTAMASGFLARWAVDPLRAVYHLYDTKRDLGFPLAASLFHIYASSLEQLPRRAADTVDVKAPVAAPAPLPRDAIIADVTAADRLGPYALGALLWSDALSKTFWATSARGNHLVQLLTDPWQGGEQLAGELTTALDKLTGAELDAKHLVPDRVELCSWQPQPGTAAQQLLTLVCDRPESERADDWTTLRARAFDRSAPSHLKEVVRIGADIADGLATLHAKGLRHGNLSPDGVLFAKDAAGATRVVLKDAWLSTLGKRQRAGGLYAAPDEMAAADEPKSDCWSLGVMLFELAAGTLPFSDAAPGEVRQAPSLGPGPRDHRRGLIDALDRILQECLLPAARLRPSAAQLSFRLRIAEYYEEYLSEFEADLFNRIEAGQRLFLIATDDRRDLETTLAHLDARGNTLFAFQEGRGIVRHATGDVAIPWLTAADLTAVMASVAADQMPAPQLTPEAVFSINGEELVAAAIEQLGAARGGRLPVLLVFGGLPWQSGPALTHLRMQRLLMQSEVERGSPIVILAGPFLFVDGELDRYIHRLVFPPLAPAELFNRVLSAPKTEGLDLPELGFDEAAEIAKQLDPISARELTYALRMCALQYECIDERVSEMRDLERARILRNRGHATYFPLAKLPDPAFIGLPPEIRDRVERWGDRARAGDALARIPTRILISGPPGCGKTSVALALGSLAHRAVVRIAPANAMGRNVGDSESNLRRTLTDAAFLSGTMVLLDGIDRFLRSATAAETGTIARMESLLLHWMDAVAHRVIVVMTAEALDTLPPQWQRRVAMEVKLASADGLVGAHNDAYRAAVFQAIFRKCDLPGVAENRALALDLAAATNPGGLRPPVLHSPAALVRPGSALAGHVVRLASAADIEWWIQETLLLHGERGGADAPGFWLDKLR